MVLQYLDAATEAHNAASSGNRTACAYNLMRLKWQTD